MMSRFYFSKVKALLSIRQTSLYRARLDVVERDPLEDILGRILEHDNCGVLHLVDNRPVATHHPARWQRDDTIAAILPREEMFQGL